MEEEAGAPIGGAHSATLGPIPQRFLSWLTCNKKSSGGTQSSRPWTEC
jgi:hypothetical protein